MPREVRLLNSGKPCVADRVGCSLCTAFQVLQPPTDTMDSRLGLLAVRVAGYADVRRNRCLGGMLVLRAPIPIGIGANGILHCEEAESAIHGSRRHLAGPVQQEGAQKRTLRARGGGGLAWFWLGSAIPRSQTPPSVTISWPPHVTRPPGPAQKTTLADGGILFPPFCVCPERWCSCSAARAPARPRNARASPEPSATRTSASPHCCRRRAEGPARRRQSRGVGRQGSASDVFGRCVGGCPGPACLGHLGSPARPPGVRSLRHWHCSGAVHRRCVAAALVDCAVLVLHWYLCVPVPSLHRYAGTVLGLCLHCACVGAERLLHWCSSDVGLLPYCGRASRLCTDVLHRSVATAS